MSEQHKFPLRHLIRPQIWDIKQINFYNSKVKLLFFKYLAPLFSLSPLKDFELHIGFHPLRCYLKGLVHLQREPTQKMNIKIEKAEGK